MTTSSNIISKESHLTPEELRREHKREFLELPNNGILEDLPEDLTGKHLTYAVVTSTQHGQVQVSYDSVSDALFEDENVHAYYLESIQTAPATLKPLAKVNIMVRKSFLGLLTTKSGKLETKMK